MFMQNKSKIHREPTQVFKKNRPFLVSFFWQAPFDPFHPDFLVPTGPGPSWAMASPNEAEILFIASPLNEINDKHLARIASELKRPHLVVAVEIPYIYGQVFSKRAESMKKEDTSAHETSVRIDYVFQMKGPNHKELRRLWDEFLLKRNQDNTV